MPHRILIFLILLFPILSAVGQSRKGKIEPINAKLQYCQPHQAKYNREIYKLTDGRWKTVDRYLNGSIRAEAYFLNRGLTEKTDTSRTYYLNGQIESEKVYFNNTRNGVWKWFYVTGRPLVVGNYFDNKAIGNWRWFDESGFEYKDRKDTLNLENLTPYRPGPISVTGNRSSDYFKLSDYPLYDAMAGYFGFNFLCYRVSIEGYPKDLTLAVHGSKDMDDYTLYYANRFTRFIPAILGHEPVESCYCLPIVFQYQFDQDVIHDQEVMNYQELSHRLFKYALGEIAKENYKMAKAALHWALFYYDQDPAYHHNLAVCYEKLGDRRSACAYFKIADILNPKLVSEQIKDACAID